MATSEHGRSSRCFGIVGKQRRVQRIGCEYVGETFTETRSRVDRSTRRSGSRETEEEIRTVMIEYSTRFIPVQVTISLKHVDLDIVLSFRGKKRGILDNHVAE